MAKLLHLKDEDVLAGSIEDHRADASAARAALDRANALLDSGDRAAAVALCLQTLQSGPLAPLVAANLIMVLRAAGGQADMWADDLLAQLAVLATDAGRKINLGRLMAVLGRTEQAAGLLADALREAPVHLAGVMALTSLRLAAKDAAGAVALWQPMFAAEPENGKLRLNLVRILAQAGFRDEARHVLALAEPLCGAYRSEFDYVAAAVRGTAASGQAAMTLEVFDGFARDYDRTLEKLGNRGPEAIGRLLEAVGLPRKRGLAVLDAGCGTGLCGALLRPYAKRLHGVDLSQKMLAEAKKKRAYDRLSRCDLGSIGTYPAGPFDLVVSSDVLVYFGDLAGVLANFARVLRPGGWLLLTVEAADTGWHLAPSGRHKHSLGYLEAALQKAGFARPKQLEHFDLRHEFGQPIRGLGLAAQRLALFG
ncbi:MAG: methyltransferase domain-containing protein [Paracoccaceae bacterium]